MSEKRLLKALRGEPVDRPPFWLMRQAGRYLPEYRALRAEVGGFLELCFDPVRAAEVTLQPIRRFGMDGAILFSDILVVPHGLGQAVSFREGEGPALEPIRSPAEAARLTVAGFHERLEPVYETVARVRQSVGDDVAVIGFAGAPWTVATYMVEGGGSKDFMAVKQWAYDDPKGFGCLMESLIEATGAYLIRQVEAGAEVLQLFDTWAGVLDEEGFGRWVIVPTAEIVRRVRAACPGVPIIGFPRGAGALYPRYARETKVDAVGIDTSVPLAWVAEALQPLCTVQGNLDPARVMAGGAAMTRAAKRIVDVLGPDRFVFNLGHGISQWTPPEHVAALAALLKGGGEAG